MSSQHSVAADVRALIDAEWRTPTRESYGLLSEYVARAQASAPFPCPMEGCTSAPANRLDTLNHLNACHLRFPSHACNDCRRNFYSKQELLRHNKRTHGADPKEESDDEPGALARRLGDLAERERQISAMEQAVEAEAKELAEERLRLREKAAELAKLETCVRLQEERLKSSGV